MTAGAISHSEPIRRVGLRAHHDATNDAEDQLRAMPQYLGSKESDELAQAHESGVALSIPFCSQAPVVVMGRREQTPLLFAARSPLGPVTVLFTRGH